MAELLVSVRSAREAAMALAGGAAVIDVKEPQHGALGRADDAVAAEVADFVAGRRAVSAAFGELLDENLPCRIAGLSFLSFLKWGLAGCGRLPDWADRVEKLRDRFPGRFVHVAYADWQCAQAPPVSDVVELACRNPGNVLLIDTCCKDASPSSSRRPTALDWLSVADIAAICDCCRSAQVRVALAGSLGADEIQQLRQVRPAWFAVRGAVCSGRRDGELREESVRQLAQLVQS